ncbi:hypothetical protein HAX54_008894 [Datura stramonium]|uniref:Uncharacterized protein n=1 Tax=Datura stramonium TaxID=4076 RepID=A0ABS8TF12_DATST|nr:hypothetical protein [Datura stramonium]
MRRSMEPSQGDAGAGQKPPREEGALKRMSAKLTKMMDETTTYNDLQVMVLDNTQEEPQGEEKKPGQEMSQFSSSTHDTIVF